MNFSHYPLRECPFCGYKTRKIGKHIRNQHPEQLKFVQFGGYSTKKIKPPIVVRDLDSLPRMALKVSA